jgi:DNA topoisomerase III
MKQNSNTIGPPQQSKPTQPSKLERYLKYYINGADLVVSWMDWDTAGEQICLQLEKFIKRFPSIKFNCNRILRANFISLRPKHIIEAFNKLNSKPDAFKAQSADAREEIDLKVGLGFTKLISNEIKSNFEMPKDRSFSFGPCIFPTLYFCYQRAMEIENFEPKEYWTGWVIIKVTNKKNLRIKIKNLEWESKQELERKMEKIFVRKYLKIVDQKKKSIVYPKPRPMGTEELLSVAAERMYLSSSKTMDAAETLYTWGLCSYPRVDANDYGKEFNAEDHLNKFLKEHLYKQNANEIFGKLLSRSEAKLRYGVDSGEDSDDNVNFSSNYDQEQEEILKELSDHSSIIPMPMFVFKK